MNRWTVGALVCFAVAVIAVPSLLGARSPWSALVLFAGITGVGLISFFLSPVAIAERARRRVLRAEIVRELELRDGVRPPA